MTEHKVEVDLERGVIVVGDLAYSIQLLAGGMETAQGVWVRFRKGKDTVMITKATSGHIAAEWLAGRDAARDE